MMKKQDLERLIRQALSEIQIKEEKIKKYSTQDDAPKKEAVTGGGTNYCCDTRKCKCNDKNHPNYDGNVGKSKKGATKKTQTEQRLLRIINKIIK